jgi:short subunit dehydrogenase-like uncharacterized protein
MLYGASGYTGALIAEQAIKRGQQPILAGRSAEKLAPLAEQLGLPYKVFGLDDVNAIANAIADMDVVLHAAGPFIHTSDPMLRACLATKTHYLDITGEIGVFENMFRYQDTALKNNTALIGGVGFDVVPTDCLALFVAQQVNAAHTLEIAFMGLNSVSVGTTKSAIENAPTGGMIRQNGTLQPYPLGKGTKRIRFSHGVYNAMPIPWGDLSTAYRTTGIPNITTYKAISPLFSTLTRLTAPIGQVVLRSGGLRHLALNIVERMTPGPAESIRENDRSYLYARAADKSGVIIAEAWLETCEPYQFTAYSAVEAVMRVDELGAAGALTPALAFGADFALAIPGTKRLNKLG